MITAGANSPYRFLDYYRMADRHLFFGRERETQILLSEVVVGRLVVLFAKTGTGKTSLINAGVRPLLEERGFATFFVRVRQDPTASAVDALRHARIELQEVDSLAAELKGVAKRLRQPIVLFFDQFEEFFIYHVRDAPAAAHRFIEDVADVYHDRAAGVHVVLSMREDFFVELDAFRDDIPTIFHNDSNLRLSWFNEEQAQAAIIRPAEAKGVQVTPGLAERIIADLATDGLVEPAQLQIVCDTLWRERTGPHMTQAGYDALGGRQRNVARQILSRRLEEEFKTVQSREQLELLERLLPALRTQRGTKYVRDLDGLLRELEVSMEQLEPVLRSLERPRLLTRHVRGDLEFVELTHDYLVSQLDELRARVSNIWPRRILLDAMERHHSTGVYPSASDDLDEVLARVKQDWEDEREGSPRRGALELGRDEAAFLFGFALHRGADTAPMFAIAASRDVSVWDQLRDTLHGDVSTASNAIDLLVQLHSPEALTLLEEAWEHPQLAAHAVEGLSAAQTRPVVDLLDRALGQERLAAYARQALIDLARSKRDRRVANRAAMVLLRDVRQALNDGTLPPSAAQGLGWVEKRATVELLQLMLADDAQAVAAQEALLALSRTPSAAVASRARATLVAHFNAALQAGRLSEWAVRSLGRVEDVAAIEVLERVATNPELRQDAKLALTSLVKSRDIRVSERAQLALTGTTPEAPREEVGRPEPVPAQPTRPERVAPVADPLDSHYRAVARAIADGRVALLLGYGVNLYGRPRGSGWRRGQYLPSGAELAAYLASYFEYPTTELQDLIRVSEYVSLMTGLGPLYEALHQLLDADYPPSALHQLLAVLPGILRDRSAPRYQLILTINFDDALERAFRERGEPFDLLVYQADGQDRGKFLHISPDGHVMTIKEPHKYTGLALERRTIIVKILGSVDRLQPERDSYVITEDHFMDYLSRGNIAAILPPQVGARLRRSHALFLGYSMRDWNLRVILRRIWGWQALTYKSWAVQAYPEAIDQEYWRKRGVDILHLPLEEYIKRLTWAIQHVTNEAD